MFRKFSVWRTIANPIVATASDAPGDYPEDDVLHGGLPAEAPRRPARSRSPDRPSQSDSRKAQDGFTSVGSSSMFSRTAQLPSCTASTAITGDSRLPTLLRFRLDVVPW